MFTKKVFISSLSIMFALSGISVVQAQNTGEQKTNSDISELLTLDENNSEFLKTLMKDGYAELGRYKVEKIKDNVYHWDEGTKKLPGGATDENGAMNNPSSMYFVLSEDGVVLVDLGNGSQNEEDIQNAKTIVESMTGDKHLSIIITHSHGDHTGFGRSKEVFSNVTVDNVYVSDADYDVAFEAISQFDGKITKVHSGETVDIYGAPYEFNVVNAHTEGSLMITDETHEALFTGDTFGSGFIWALFETNGGNPLAALDKGCSLARKILNNNPSLSILAGHRWQQFWEDNAQRPNEMSIQYFNDMAQVISGLLDGTTISNSYTAASWAPDAVELSSNGAKAKIDTLPKYIEAYKKAVELLQLVGITNAEKRMKNYPHQLSGGMRQRIVIAIALSCDPYVLICDEPTTALDVTIQAKILELIQDIQKKKDLSVIYITHDLGVVAKVADYVNVMYAGKIVETGTIDEIFYDPRHPYTWGLLSSMPDLDTDDDELYTIPGTPPNLAHEVKGDAFAPRNKYALNIDLRIEPPMFKVPGSTTHKVASWLMHEKAPKVEMPVELKNRLEKMKKEGVE